jgi:hypothetical protein
MSVEAEQLDEWIGAEVVDPAGEKLGKVAEVFYRGNEPLVIEIRSGIAGRKHHLAALRGATVSKSHLRLSSSEVVQTDGGLGAGELEQLGGQDDRLQNLAVDDLEGGQARDERRKAAEQAAANADALDREARAREQEAKRAAGAAHDAASNAKDADQARARAEAKAQAAHREADELGR